MTSLLERGLAASVRNGVLRVEYAGAPWTVAQTKSSEFVDLPAVSLPAVGPPQGRVLGQSVGEVRIGDLVYRVEPLRHRIYRVLGFKS